MTDDTLEDIIRRPGWHKDPEACEKVQTLLRRRGYGLELVLDPGHSISQTWSVEPHELRLIMQAERALGGELMAALLMVRGNDFKVGWTLSPADFLEVAKQFTAMANRIKATGLSMLAEGGEDG